MRRERAGLHLSSGSRVAIVGGGPSGAFFAHFARKLAAERGIELEIVVFDGKSFGRRGPAGCNMGAGVVAESLNRLLRAEGFELPEERIQRHIQGYRLYTGDSVLPLLGPAGQRDITAVFRGAGPRFSAFSYNVSFDDFLLQRVVDAAGGQVKVIPEQVGEIGLPRRPAERATLHYGSGRRQAVLEADLVVGAFGLNSAMLRKMVDLDFGYKPPRTVRACQTELPLDPSFIQQTLGDEVHTFILGIEGIRFGALTPKGVHVTVTIVGSRDLGLSDLSRFLDHPVVRSVLPPDWQPSGESCYCFPRLSLGAATRPFADRLVIVGDAAFCRFFKNGFESAFLTARLAAESALTRGVSARDFARGYQNAARPLVRDNLFGHLLFQANDVVSRHRLLAETRRQLLAGPIDDPVVALLHEIHWGMLTGSLSYGQVTRLAMSPRLAVRAMGTLASVALGQVGRPLARSLGWRG